MQQRQIVYSLSMISTVLLCGVPAMCMGASLGDVANNLLGPTRGITQLAYGVGYVAGAGMLIMALTQYKAHRDNPSQVRLGTPIAFLIFGLVFIFIPLIAQYSKSSDYVAEQQRQQRIENREPLEYGKHRPTHRPEKSTSQRQSSTSTVPDDINPDDSDWY